MVLSAILHGIRRGGREFGREFVAYSRAHRRRSAIEGAIAGVALLCAGAGNYYFSDRREEEIFNGMIEGQRIMYTEGKTNKMIIKNGVEEYTLIDSDKPTNLDWQLNNAPAYNSDVLERIEIRKRNGTENLTSDDISDLTLKGQKARDLLGKYTKFYNGIRREIRDKKRENYENSLKGAIDYPDAFIRLKGL